MNLALLQSIKHWHVCHRHDHPVEYQLFDTLLMFWVMGWVGWLPVFAFDAFWVIPLLCVAMAAPTVYVAWRIKAHQQRKLRCDWVAAAR